MPYSGNITLISPLVISPLLSHAKETITFNFGVVSASRVLRSAGLLAIGAQELCMGLVKRKSKQTANL